MNFGLALENKRSDRRIIDVSVPAMFQLFHPCAGDYIATTCKGRCCSSNGGNYNITVLPHEQAAIEALGVRVENGRMALGEKERCPFHTPEGFCRINDTKPFGCNVSPFYFMRGKTGPLLFVRNRFRFLICFRGGNCADKVPAYKAHPWALRYIFGAAGYEELCQKLEAAKIAGVSRVSMEIPDNTFQRMLANDAHKTTMKVKK